jgi:hypothetical protein
MAAGAMHEVLEAFDPALRRHARWLRAANSTALLIGGALIGAWLTERAWTWLVLAAVGSLLALLLQEHLATVDQRVRSTDATAAVEHLLGSVGHALAMGARRQNVSLRAHCHRNDPARRVLTPYGRPFEQYPTADRHMPIPYDEDGSEVMVIVQALRSGGPVCADLSPQHSEFERKHHVPKLGCVLAAPIIGADRRVLGTVSFDSKESAAVTFPKREQACAAAFRLADAIATLWGEGAR